MNELTVSVISERREKRGDILFFSCTGLREERKVSMAKILVWDDVADAGVLIKRILQEKGHEICVFVKEKEALTYTQSNKIDLALLDVNMRMTSGVKRLKRLKESTPTTSVVMLTYCPTVKTKREALRLGACELWVKPLENAMLEAKVDRKLKDLDSSLSRPVSSKAVNVV